MLFRLKGEIHCIIKIKTKKFWCLAHTTREERNKQQFDKENITEYVILHKKIIFFFVNFCFQFMSKI